MGFEVDFLAVGDCSRSGDAIAFRYGNLSGGRDEQIVVVIDGGTLDSGKGLVQHILTYYGTNAVDYAVSSHPDADHASGLTVVLEELRVGQLLMHLPWEHAAEIRQLFVGDRLTVRGLEDRLERALQNAKDLEVIARRKSIPIHEPFAGDRTADGSLLVLGPSRDYYQSLVCDFRRTPEARMAELFEQLFGLGRAAQEVAVRVLESLQVETLTDSGVTSAENNSSVILLLRTDGESLLFTGDAGISALTGAADFAESVGMEPRGLRFLDVPHHGSRRNVGPTILNRIRARTAFISVCKDGAPKHPSQRAVNALIRRGSNVYATKGANLWHHDRSAPARPSYRPATRLEFVEEIDEEEE